MEYGLIIVIIVIIIIVVIVITVVQNYLYGTNGLTKDAYQPAPCSCRGTRRPPRPPQSCPRRPLRFDFLKLCLIFAPEISIILFFASKKTWEKCQIPKLKTVWTEKGPVLSYKILIFGKFCHFHYVK